MSRPPSSEASVAVARRSGSAADPVLNTDDNGSYEVVLTGEVVVHLRLAGRCDTSHLVQAHRRDAPLDHQTGVSTIRRRVVDLSPSAGGP